jgi:hypothetical protein
MRGLAGYYLGETDDKQLEEYLNEIKHGDELMRNTHSNQG